MAVSPKFQKRFFQLVEDSELKRTELRKNIGITSATFSGAVMYGILPTPKNLIKIADYFGVSINYLLGETETNDFIEAVSRGNFKDRFNSLCEEKSITRYRVSEDCGFNYSIIVRWFDKDYIPSFETLVTLCDYFNVSPDYLLGRSDYKA